MYYIFMGFGPLVPDPNNNNNTPGYEWWVTSLDSEFTEAVYRLMDEFGPPTFVELRQQHHNP